MLTLLLLVAALTLLAAGLALLSLSNRAARWVHLRCVDGRMLLVQAPVSWADERSNWLTLLALFRFTFSSARSRRMQLCDVGPVVVVDRFSCRGADTEKLGVTERIVNDDSFPVSSSSDRTFYLNNTVN